MGGIVNTLRYKEGVEFQQKMLEEHPFVDGYWNDHMRPSLEDIEVPAYVVASWTSNLHPYGTLRAWRKIASRQKWLRVHNTQEWPDQQLPENRDDLRAFFDHFLKGANNGWETTPPVRLAILDPTGHDRVNVPYRDFPVPGTQYRRLHLDAADLSLRETGDLPSASAEYLVGNQVSTPRNPFSKPDWIDVPRPTDQVQFRVTFDEDTVLCGYFRIGLHVSTDASDDMDLFMYVSKEDSLGQPYQPAVLGVDFMGAEARLRVSHRRLESTELYDWKHEHTREERISAGEIVGIETVFWPLGMLVRAGEALVLTIAASERQLFEFPTAPAATRNAGRHVIHTGNETPSWLELPVLPGGLSALDGRPRPGEERE